MRVYNLSKAACTQTSSMVECVANVSEGRNPAVVQTLQACIESIPGICFLHADIGYDAHRTVFTFAGQGKGVAAAVLALAQGCLQHIDMRQHKGIHPRMGALDVCPIIPLSEKAHDEALHATQEIALGFTHLGLGGWYYAQSAIQPAYALLPNVRKGQYEGVAARKDQFDFGRYNPRFGAVALGVRPLLVAFNVNIDGADLPLVKEVASVIRATHPEGMPGVRAIGWSTPAFACHQVSCNLVDLTACSPKSVFDRIQKEVERRGAKVRGAELIGLAPRSSFSEFDTIPLAVSYLGLNAVVPFDPNKRILESALSHCRFTI